MAAAVENAARFDDQAWRMNFAGDNTFGLNFDPAFCKDDAIKPASDDDLIPFNLAFDLGPFTQNQRLIAEDVSFHLRFNAKRAGKLQSAFKADGPVQKSGPLALRLRHSTVI